MKGENHVKDPVLPVETVLLLCIAFHLVMRGGENAVIPGSGSPPYLSPASVVGSRIGVFGQLN